MGEAVVEQVVGRPAPALRSFVERYVGYRQEGAEPRTHQGLPSRHVTLVVSLGSPVVVTAMPDPSQAPGSFAALVGGLHAAPVTIGHDGRQHGVQLELDPLGARALLGLPAAEVASCVVHLGDLFGGTAAELVDRLVAAPGWPERFGVLDEVLARRAMEAPGGPAPEVAWAWRRLVATGGAIEVGALAAEVGWSRRHLGERFRRELGLSPKVAARVLRFERACHLLRRSRRPNLAALAATCGYCDQAHLAREWRALAGCTLTAWMAAELPFVQDEATTAGAR